MTEATPIKVILFRDDNKAMLVRAYDNAEVDLPVFQAPFRISEVIEAFNELDISARVFLHDSKAMYTSAINFAGKTSDLSKYSADLMDELTNVYRRTRPEFTARAAFGQEMESIKGRIIDIKKRRADMTPEQTVEANDEIRALNAEIAVIQGKINSIKLARIERETSPLLMAAFVRICHEVMSELEFESLMRDAQAAVDEFMAQKKEEG